MRSKSQGHIFYSGLNSLAPHVRLLLNIILLATIIVIPASPPGVATATALVLFWLFVTGVPLQRLPKSLRALAIIVLPLTTVALLALLPLCSTVASWCIPFFVAWRSSATIALSFALATQLPLAELRPALEHLPLPHALSSLILQTAHQTALLFHEIRGIRTSLILRSSRKARLSTRLRVIAALPLIWLIRMATRAERIAIAMELRGFDGGCYLRGRPSFTHKESLVLLLAGLVLVGAGWWRWI